MKDDEKQFLIQVYERCEKNKKKTNDFLLNLDDRTTPRKIINEEGFPIHYKRAWYLLDKWSRKGWYEYGVTLDLGWLTKEGIEKVKELLEGE